MSRPTRQELWCHDCEHYVQFTIDEELDGNHVLSCPNCGHEHCRVVRSGKITDIRWDQRNGTPTWIVTGNITYTAASTFSSSTASDFFLYQAWSNTTSGT